MKSKKIGHYVRICKGGDEREGNKQANTVSEENDDGKEKRIHFKD